jgi:hypothetical protein
MCSGGAKHLFAPTITHGVAAMCLMRLAGTSAYKVIAADRLITDFHHARQERQAMVAIALETSALMLVAAGRQVITMTAARNTEGISIYCWTPDSSAIFISYIVKLNTRETLPLFAAL